MGPSTPSQPAPAQAAPPVPTGGVDLLSGGLDQLLDFGGGGAAPPPQATQPPSQLNQNPMGGGLLDLMGGGAPAAPQSTGLDALGNMGLFGAPTQAEEVSNKVNF